jgi:hypothetical protein
MKGSYRVASDSRELNCADHDSRLALAQTESETNLW